MRPLRNKALQLTRYSVVQSVRDTVWLPVPRQNSFVAKTLSFSRVDTEAGRHDRAGTLLEMDAAPGQDAGP